MFIDARSVPTGTNLETDVCIVGAGAAGITLGRELISSGFRVAIFESGDIDFQEATQDLYAGDNIGRDTSIQKMSAFVFAISAGRRTTGAAGVLSRIRSISKAVPLS